MLLLHKGGNSGKSGHAKSRISNDHAIFSLRYGKYNAKCLVCCETNKKLRERHGQDACRALHVLSGRQAQVQGMTKWRTRASELPKCNLYKLWL